MKIIGLLLDSLDVFGNDLVAGALRGLRGSGYKLVSIVGGPLHPNTDGLGRQNFLYKLSHGSMFDGFLVSGSLSHFVALDDLAGFCSRLSPAPVVTVSVSVPGFASATCDNAPGFVALLDHLIRGHGLTKLAYIGGPVGQQEAEERKALFVSTVSALGGHSEPSWMLDGDFTVASGKAAAETLVRHARTSDGKLGFEALVSANDAMAAGALERLGDLGFRVPEDLVVTGFDGSVEWSYTEPPITSVHQNTALQAEAAARSLVHLLSGGSPAPDPRLPSVLLVRESCGCPARAVDPLFPGPNGAAQWRLVQRLRTLAETLQACASLPELLNLLATSIERLGVTGLHLVLLEGEGSATAPARLHLRWSQGQPAQVLAEGIPFAAGEWLPGGLGSADPPAPPDLLVVEALHSRGVALGFLILRTGERGSQVSSIVRTLLSESIQAVRFLEERRRIERQLVESAKQSAIRSLVVGVAHEINTPLGVAVTGVSYAYDLAQRLLTAVREGRSSTEICELELGRILQSEEPVQAGLTRVANLVNTFKQLAVEPSGETRRLFPIQECIRAAQAWFSYSGRSAPAILRASVSLEIDGPEAIELDSYPWTLTSLLISLMSNSLDHAFTAKSSGTIRLEVEDRGDSMALSYSDDGVGMDERVRDHIWEPFFTTGRSTGHSGLGLHIVYHQVTGLLGGTIACSSTPGEGVVFELVIPKAAPAPRS